MGTRDSVGHRTKANTQCLHFMALILAFLYETFMTKNYSRCLLIKKWNNILFSVSYNSSFTLRELFLASPLTDCPVCASKKRWCFKNLWFLAGWRVVVCVCVGLLNNSELSPGSLQCKQKHCALTVSRNIRTFTFIFNTRRWSTTTANVKGKSEKHKLKRGRGERANDRDGEREGKMKNLFELLNQRLAAVQRATRGRGRDSPAIYIRCKLLVRKCSSGNAMNKIKQNKWWYEER